MNWEDYLTINILFYSLYAHVKLVTQAIASRKHWDQFEGPRSTWLNTQVNGQTMPCAQSGSTFGPSLSHAIIRKKPTFSENQTPFPGDTKENEKKSWKERNTTTVGYSFRDKTGFF